MKPDDPRHGTTTGYSQGCRCNKCRAANARYARERQTTLAVVPRDLYDRVKAFAEREGLSVRSVVMDAVGTYLDLSE